MNKFAVFVIVVTLVDALLIVMIYPMTADMECPPPVYIYDQEHYRTYQAMCHRSVELMFMIPILLMVNFVIILIFKAAGME